MRGVILSLVAALAIGCASAPISGTAKSTGPIRTPIATESVRIYREPPAEFEIIGDITVQGGQDRAMAFLQGSAAMFGANGVLITREDESSSGVAFIAKAIYVTKEKK